MSFWSIIAVGRTYTVFTTGSPPQAMRMSLLHAQQNDKSVVRFFYPGALRLQVFVGTNFMEDVNMHGGQAKAQLVRQGKWAGNGPSGTYLEQGVSVSCGCTLAGMCVSAGASTSSRCDTPSNTHGANAFDRSSNFLSIVIGGHDVASSFIDVRAMPVVQASFTSVIASCDLPFFCNRSR
jgi:hypothetical protein